jgi:hypothetical protein
MIAEERDPPTNEPRHRRTWPATRLVEHVRGAQRWVAAARYVNAHNRRLGRPSATLQFYPMRPDAKARISLVVARLGLRIRIGVVPGVPTIAWDTGTWFDDAAYRRLPPGAVNRECIDISKGTVDRAWASVAGYSVEVDPLAFDGPMVIKSEANGRHDGRIVHGPIGSRHPGYVYQRFVDAVEGDQMVELRTTVIGTQIPLVLLRYRPRTRWFAGSTKTLLADPAEEFSPTELAQIIRFAALIGMDYGELDVLRDKASGRIYVLDSNRTPNGPADSETSPLIEHVTTAVSEAFSHLMAERWP